MADTIRMTREGVAADVHPLEVDRWSAEGWERVEAEPKVERKPRRSRAAERAADDADSRQEG